MNNGPADTPDHTQALRHTCGGVNDPGGLLKLILRRRGSLMFGVKAAVWLQAEQFSQTAAKSKHKASVSAGINGFL